MKKHKNTFGITGFEYAVNYFAELAVNRGGWINKAFRIKDSLVFYKDGTFDNLCVRKDSININTPEGFSKALTLMQEVEEEQLYGECIKSDEDNMFTVGKIYKIVGELPFDSGMWEFEKDNDGDINGWRKEYFKLVPESEYLKQQERENQIKQVQEFGWIGNHLVKYDFICPYSKNKFMKGDKVFIVLSSQLDQSAYSRNIDFIDIQGKNKHLAYFHNESDAKAWNKAKFGEKEADFICYHSGNRFKIGDNSYKVSLMDGEIHQGEIHHVHKERLSGKETGLAHFKSKEDAQAWKEAKFGESDKKEERYEMYFINASFKVWVEVDLGDNYHLKDKMIESGLVRVKKQNLI